ncbi:MAG: TetR/AcrR family transcriptional regulator [Candidatus Methanomethylophilaceae archaeon]
MKKLMEISPKYQKKTNSERKQESRKKIIQVSIELFKEKGYTKTTTRQILQKAGILNGSLYNTFENKEEVFKAVVLQAYDAALGQSRKLLEGNDDLVVALAFPLAMELYAGNKDAKSAELLYAAHTSWKITNELVDRTILWISVYFEKYDIKMNSQTVRTNLLALLGCVGNFVARYNNGERNGYKDELRVGLEMFCTLFRIPAYDLDAVVKRMADILESNEFTINGFEL